MYINFSLFPGKYYNSTFLYLIDDEPQKESKEISPNNSSRDSILRCLICLGDLARYTLDLPGSPFGPNSYLLPVRYYHQVSIL